MDESPPKMKKAFKLKNPVASIRSIELTFYRVHLVAFVFIPLISSGIFYGCNGRFRISFLDSLFLCYSSMTVTGLSTVDLSTLTVWQQVMLFLLMMVGDITTVSWIMVLVRKHYFRTHCENLPDRMTIFPTRTAFLASISSPIAAFRPRDVIPANGRYAPQLNFHQPTPVATMSPVPTTDETAAMYVKGRRSEEGDGDNVLSDVHTFTSSPRPATLHLSPVQSRASARRGVDFDLTTSMTTSMRQRRMSAARAGVPFPARTMTVFTNQDTSGNTDVPGPTQFVKNLFKRSAPGAYRKFQRKMTIPYTSTLEASRTKWLNFDLDTGRNSNFYTETLTDEQLEMIGGAEYRALKVLSYLVPTYFVLSQIITYLIFAPWLSTSSTYDSVFEAQPRLVKKPWFSLFQVMAAYTGGGLSLVDLGMVPFQTAYLMIFPLMFVILAGNHALPIFMRLIIWIFSKFTEPESDLDKALDFLLHHPRRCYFYLFPSHQTWFLVIVLILMSVVEWVAFEVLNTGLEFYDAMSTGAKIVTGLFQGLAARASGFAIVPLASIAPALQFLYVVMMYIAVYPVAMSIRSTNTYEEGSLGVFEEPLLDEEEFEDKDKELGDPKDKEPRQRVARYLGWHLRRQMSDDIWWMVWGVFLVAIIERDNLLDDSKKWFDLFRVLFELVSAFGGIGLSLGFPSDNMSFVGVMRPLSKLVIIVVMVRGRHRGLPVAIDRAVKLPRELATKGRNIGKEKDNGLGPAEEITVIPRDAS
ncbi:TrkH-domain-containing protein [Guyanagaster necrorhizus]|uniref:TrkH-domain-containing protein n=1 Tax=Guyanagaster necrorhizus TaxID=856835 RepID=A0A9P8ATF9_9AGAR|nr:TrkH-domain-containing protein [Guyanagaster necrorhizus MCA 3950]KAG7447155.1 TrkH-domain-containing protein [Guyanagaster necrorhizus MCA 3950]